MSALAAAGLCVTYGDRVALRDITLSIAPRRITALVGPSGCGKTSFLSCLNRLTDLIPGCRVAGSLRLGDLDILAPSTDVTALRRRVGMIFQKPNPFPMSVRKNLHLPLREHGRQDAGEAAEAALREVGLWDEVKDRLDEPATSLSGGQQQRLCIARALSLRPEVMLFDEPCSALDPMASGVVEDLIVGLKGRYTLVVVTHNLAQAKRIADDAAVFWVKDGAGRMIENGAARTVFERPADALVAAYVSGVRG